MADRFEWVFELIEKVSKPAKQATDAATGFEKELKKVEEQIDRIKHHPVEFKKLGMAKKELRELSGGSQSFAQRFEEMGQAVRRVGFVQNLMLGAEALHIGFEMGEKVVDVVFDIGKELLSAAGHAERFKIAFQSMAGEEGGSEALEYIEKIKKASELSGAQLKEVSAELLTAGFHAKELGQALPAALDIAGFKGGGLENVQAAISAMSKIRESGKVSSKVLMNLGLGENAEKNLLSRMGKSKGQSEEQIKKAMEAGKLDPAEVLHQVYEMIIERQHGALGTTAEKMTNTVTGKLAKLKQLPEEIFEKWAASPGFGKFSSALGKVLEKLDPNGPNGKKIFAAIDTIATKVVGLIASFADGDGIDKFIDKVTDITSIFETARSALDKVVTASEVIATIWAGSKIVNAFAALTPLMAAMTPAAAALAIPLAAVAAAAGSIYYAFKKISEAIDELGGKHAVWNDLKDAFGGYFPAIAKGNAGFAAQKAENEKNLELAHGSASSEPAIPAESSRTSPGAARVSQAVHVETHVHVNGDANPDEIASAVNQSLPGALQQGMERMAVSSGVM